MGAGRIYWFDVFGAAALGTLINVGVATSEDPQITFSGIGATARDPVDQAIQDGFSAAPVQSQVAWWIAAWRFRQQYVSRPARGFLLS
jgi:hypothetical protein